MHGTKHDRGVLIDETEPPCGEARIYGRIAGNGGVIIKARLACVDIDNKVFRWTGNANRITRCEYQNGRGFAVFCLTKCFGEIDGNCVHHDTFLEAEAEIISQIKIIDLKCTEAMMEEVD